jgi:Family of unknown function (DUF5309)
MIRGAQNTGTMIGAGAGTQLSSMVIRSFANFQKYLEPDETPFTSSVSTGKAVNQKKVEFGTGFLAPHQVTLAAGVAAGGTTATIQLAAGDAAKLQKTDLLKITSLLPAPGTEHWWVTGFTGAANTVDVRRAMGSTTAIAHTLQTPAQKIEILGPASQENADSPLSPIIKGGIEYNFPQLFDYAVQVSQRADNTPDYQFDGASRYDEYLQQIMTSASIDFEKTAIMGRRNATDEVSMVLDAPTAEPTMMGGLDFFTDNAYDLAGAALTETHLRNLQRDLWTNVGSNAATSAISGGFMREAVSSLWNANRYATVKDQDTTLVWNSVETEYGKLRFTISRYIPAGALYFVNLKDIEIRPYKGGEWADVQLPVNGPYKKGRFTGDYTMLFTRNAARAKIINASVNAADYPNLA